MKDIKSPMQYSTYDPKLSHEELGKAISSLGIKKANTKIWQLFLLGVLAGLYISFGGHLFLVALAENLGKVAGGIVFSIGLVLVIVAGAELFTGNIVMIVGTLGGFFSVHRMVRNWSTVYVGNFVGAFVFAVLIWKSGLLGTESGLNHIGNIARTVAEKKLALTFNECFIRGIFCNMLVILAVIMATMSKDVISKIFCCILPIMAFVACGFEHCVANMYLIPIGLLAKGIPVWQHVMVFKNILPVTVGNIVGGIFILLIHPNRIRQLVSLVECQLQQKGLQ